MGTTLPEGSQGGSRGSTEGPQNDGFLTIFGDFRPLRCQKTSGAMRTQRHRSFLAPGRPETLKNVQKSSVSIDFCPQKCLKEIWVPKGCPPWDFWGSGHRVGKGFGRGIERRSKDVYLTPQTSLKRLLPEQLLISNFGPISRACDNFPPLFLTVFGHFWSKMTKNSQK